MKKLAKFSEILRTFRAERNFAKIVGDLDKCKNMRYVLVIVAVDTAEILRPQEPGDRRGDRADPPPRRGRTGRRGVERFDRR